MSRYFEAPDAYGDPCLWERKDDRTTHCILSMYDLEDDYRDSLWPLIVEAVTSA